MRKAKTLQACQVRFGVVSIPLRGKGMRKEEGKLKTKTISTVSIPLRGKGMRKAISPYQAIGYIGVSIPLRGKGMRKEPA